MRKSNLKPKRNTEAKLRQKTSEDNRLTYLALHLDCLFDRGVNFQDRIITLSDEVDIVMFNILDSALSHMESEGGKSVKIRIHSFGGSAYDALAIVGRLKSSPCRIITEGYGEIMSAATLILACGNKRKISKYAWFMHHEAAYAMEGKHTEHKDSVRQMEREERQWANIMAEFSNKNSDYWYNLGKKDTYLTPEELLKLGIVDEII